MHIRKYASTLMITLTTWTTNKIWIATSIHTNDHVVVILQKNK